MSRCFPFPPPGYDKKITTDPLIKEKYKEKKHKKDKDKEKKEGEERKSRDRSKDKHKERKKKNKDRKGKEKEEEKSKHLEEKKTEVLTNTGDREKLVPNTVQSNSSGESKYVQDLARRIRSEEEATGSQSAQKITNQKGITGKAFENSSFCPIQETNHRKSDDSDDKRFSIQKKFAVAKSSENAIARVPFGADQKRAEAVGNPMEDRDQARHTEFPEKSRRKESASRSDKPRDKEEQKAESINKTHQEKPKWMEGPKLEEMGKDSLEKRNCRPPDISRASVKNLIAEGGKRKDLETNGFLYVISNRENGTTPHKLQRHSASMENGIILSAHRTPAPASEVQGTTCKPEVKEVKINGFVVPGEKQKVCPPNSLAATMQVKVKDNGEAKPPHPDLSYLNQILNVPKRELFLEVDGDQEWLYGPLGVKLKKARTDSPDSGESLQVWNQALRIESADISALPYVVPY